MRHHIIGPTLKALRIREGFTQKALAEVCEVSKAQYVRYESINDTDPPLPVLVKLHEKFGDSLDSLILGKESTKGKITLPDAFQDLIEMFLALGYKEQEYAYNVVKLLFSKTQAGKYVSEFEALRSHLPGLDDMLKKGGE